MHKLTENIGPYVFDNIVDGVLLLTYSGTIAYMNKSAQNILSISDEQLNESFLGRFLQHSDMRNDEFCQIIIEALYNKHQLICKKANYYTEQGEALVLQIKSSYWRDPDDETKNGVLLIIQDVSAEEHLKRERDDAIFVFSVLLAFIGVWTLFFRALEHFNIEMPLYCMTYIMIALGMFMTWLAFRRTNFKFSDMGLSVRNIRKPLLINACISLAGCLIMIAGKWLLIRSGSDLFPEQEAFWDLRFDLGMMLYPLSVLMQEFLSQGIIHECLIRILNRHSYVLSILFSAILFTTLHVHRGFMFMLYSLILVCAISVMYRKQRTIWGLCITHYTLGMTAFLLNFA